MSESRRGGWDCHVHIFDAKLPAKAGHYQPGDCRLEQIESAAAACGVDHLVLVQPSVYGSNNGLLLHALQSSHGRHRGVLVIDEIPDAAELARMHQLGVRGARLNRVSPVGGLQDVASEFERLAPMLLSQQWHLQWYVTAEDLPSVAALHGADAPTAVLDHLAGLRAGLPEDHPAWRALETLANRGAWLKLSGWYRLEAKAPYEQLLDPIRRVASLFGDRLVWGSDWPHTFFTSEHRPSYASTWDPVVHALGEQGANELRLRLPAIYR